MEFEDISHFGSFFSYEKNKSFNVLISPRKSSGQILIQPSQQERDKSLSALNQWFQDNVVNYLDPKSSWRGGLFPLRLLYLYGVRGIGKLSTVMLYCMMCKLNLIYVHNQYFTPDMPEIIFKKAKENKPCIIYFDNAEEMVKDPNRNSPFVSMYNIMLDAIADDIWVILASSEDMLSMPVYMSLLFNDSRSVVYAPIPTDDNYKARVIMGMLQHLTNSDEYPYLEDQSDAVSKEWDRFISRLIKASEYSTYRDIWNFFVVVFRRFKQTIDRDELSKPSQSRVALIKCAALMYPSVNLFKSFFNTLSLRQDTNGVEERTLSPDFANPSARLVSMNRIYDVYLSYHPEVNEQQEEEIRVQPPVASSYKSQTTPIPLREDFDSFHIAPPQFSEPIQSPTKPALKSSLELKRPSITLNREGIFIPRRNEYEEEDRGYYDYYPTPTASSLSFNLPPEFAAVELPFTFLREPQFNAIAIEKEKEESPIPNEVNEQVPLALPSLPEKKEEEEDEPQTPSIWVEEEKQTKKKKKTPLPPIKEIEESLIIPHRSRKAALAAAVEIRNMSRSAPPPPPYYSKRSRSVRNTNNATYTPSWDFDPLQDENFISAKRIRAT